MLYYTVFRNDSLETWCHIFQTERGQQLLSCFGLHKDTLRVWDIDFEERLFHNNLPSHLQAMLSDTERASITANPENM